jgi:hypothetical protein
VAAFKENSVVSMERVACAPGRKTRDYEGGKEAAVVAKRVVEIISKDMAHASKFIRDMVKRNFVGGAGGSKRRLVDQRIGVLWKCLYSPGSVIHLEVFDNAPETLEQLVDYVSQWVLQ